MLKTLLWIRIKALADSMFKRRGRKSGGKGRMAVFALLILYCVIVFGAMFGFLFYSMYAPFAELGMDWLYYSVAAMLSTMLCFVGSVFFTQSTLYEAKDNELLMSMPIPAPAILGSRMALLLLVNYAYSLMIMLPCGIVRCIVAPVTVPGVLCYMLCALLLPLLPTTLSCAVGWVLALVISRVRNKSLVSLILSLIFLGAYFAVCFNMQNYIEKMVANGAAIGAAIRSAMPPFYAMGLAMANGDILQLMRFALWCLVPFGIAFYLLSVGFVRIATRKKGTKRARYTPTVIRESSPLKAMVSKELRRLGSSSSYMLNGCLGAVLCVAVSVITLIKGPSLLQTLTNVYAGGLDAARYAVPVVIVLECMMLSLNCISAPSISLEGRNLWLLQSAPVAASEVLMSKVLTHIVVCAPAALISSFCFSMAFPMSAPDILLLFLVPLVLTAFIAQLGVTANLKWPRLDYTNEAVVIKQSVSVMVTIFGGIGITMLAVLLYLLVLRPYISLQAVLWIYAALLALGNVVLYHYLTHGGAKAFANLNRE